MTSATIHSHAADPNTRSLAQKKRGEKSAAAEEIGIDAVFIVNLVEAFRVKIRADDLLEPIFAERITDWPPRLARMKAC